MNYASLLQSVQDYLENDEATLVAEIPLMVALAEEKINRVAAGAHLPAFRKNQYASLTTDNEYITMPTDWLATHSLAVDNSGFQFLVMKDVNFIREAYPDSTVSGVPKYYANFDNNTFLLGPTPDSTYTVQLHYYYEPESIVTASTTWIGDNAENALLYGTLLEAYRFQKGDADVFQEYHKAYDDAIQQLVGLGALENRDDYRHGIERV